MTVSGASVLSGRLAALKAEAMARDGSIGPDQNPDLLSVALWRAMGSGRSRVQVRARSLLEQVRLARIEIRPGWSLAGHHLPMAVTRWASPDASYNQHFLIF